ncbi:MAG: hypothetical protein ACK4SQ_16150 [Allorhizobium sp.]
MPIFEVRFVKPATGRLNKVARRAYDRGALDKLLAAEGISPTDVQVVKRGATPRQLEYLKDLGVAVTEELSQDEASDLISNTTGRLVPANDIPRLLAARYQVEITRYTSKEAIYRMITAHLLEAENEEALAEWYSFRVYRSRVDRGRTDLLDVPSDPRFRKTALQLLSDEKARKSMMAAARATRTGFRWFGEFHGRQGDSDRSAAYQFASIKLQENGLLPTRHRAENTPQGAGPDLPVYEPILAEKRGCLGVASFIVIVVPAVLFLSVKLLAAPSI